MRFLLYGEICCSVAKSRPILCDPMDYNTPGSSVLHHLLDFAQIHVHWVSDAILTIPTSAAPFSFCPQSFLASGSFPMSGLFISGGQSIGASAPASVLPMITQGWFPLRLTGWISLQSKGLSKSLLQHHSLKASVLWHSTFFMVQLSHPYMATGKPIALSRWNFVGKICLCFLIHCLGLS